MVYETEFPTINEATAFGHGLSGMWLLFEKKATVQSDSSWKLLPYGNYEQYQSGITMAKYKMLVYVVLAVVVFFIAKKFIG